MRNQIKKGRMEAAAANSGCANAYTGRRGYGDAVNDLLTGDDSANVCGLSQDMECRGWDVDQSGEFIRQRDKLLAALTAVDADMIGLTELENTTGVEPLADLVAGLSGYAYVDTGTIGTDAIKVGVITARRK